MTRRAVSHLGLGVIASIVASVIAIPIAAADGDCARTVGALRARRLLRHCTNVNTSARNPCTNSVSCSDLAAFTMQFCDSQDSSDRELKMTPRSSSSTSCREERDPAISQLTGTELDQARLFAASIDRDRDLATRAQRRIAVVAPKVEQLAKDLQLAVAALRSHQGDFSKNLKTTRASLAKYLAALHKPSAVGLAETRLSLNAQATALSASGDVVTKSQAVVDGLASRIAELARASEDAKEDASEALLDLQDAKSITQPLVAHMSKPAPGKPSAPAVADLSVPARALWERVKISEADARSTVAAAKSEAQRIKMLASTGAMSPFAIAQRTQTSKKLTKDLADAQVLRARSDAIRVAAANRHRPDAPSAKGAHCDIEKVDFGNFDYPDGPSLRNGKAKDAQVDGTGAPLAAHVSYADLNTDGKKEAIVWLNTGFDDGAVHFFEIDDHCTIQQIDALHVDVPGEAKGKVYSYTEIRYEDSNVPHVPNQVQELVQVQYMNEAIVETKRQRITQR